MITEEEVRNALKTVMDPELGRSIVDLGMVREIHIADGQVDIVLALTVMGCPLKDRIVNDVKSAIRGLDGALITNVQLVEMTAEERSRAVGEPAKRRSMSEAFNDVNHVIAVMSGKGGVGKSSVAALLAVALRKKGERVGLLDADITGPSIPRMFGLHNPPKMSPFGILPVVSSTGIKVISINLLLSSEDVAIVWRGPLISGAIQQFWGDVLWERLDTLVIDLPPGTSDATLTVMQSIPLSGILLVTSPQDLAGMIVRKAARMAQTLEIPIIGLVENMSYVRCPACGEKIEVFGPSQGEETARMLGVPLLGQIPLDPELAIRCDNGQVEWYTGDVFDPIAARVAELVPDVKSKPLSS
ncbi:MAG: Mrp/NBP35 family ATP-binding protein [Anaerolineae bacterium]